MKIELKAQTIFILRQILSRGGWCKGIQEIYDGGKLLSETLPQIEIASFSETPYSLDLSEKGIELCKKAFDCAAKDGAIPPSDFAMELIDKLGLIEKPRG